MMNRDFSDLLSEINAAGVEYIVVDAHALAAHGDVRATKDLEAWIRSDRQNASRVLRALARFGAPLVDLAIEDLCAPGCVFQIGVAPVRIDIRTAIDGVAFDDAWERRLVSRFAGVPVNVLARADLVRNKKATGRTQDLADVEWLESSESD